MQALSFRPFNKTFIQIPTDLVDIPLPPRASQILNKLFKYCSLDKAVVWVNQGWLAKGLGIHRETLGKWIRYLAKIGILIFTGRWKDGRYKIYKIVWGNNLGQKEAPLSHDFTSSVIVGPRPTLSLDINIEENIRELKQTTEEVVVVENLSKEKVANPKKELIKKLMFYGFRKEVARQILAKNPLEIVNRQIERLEYELAHGTSKIHNKAGWLRAAIKRNDQPSKAQEVAKQAKSEDEQRKRYNKATLLLKDAERENDPQQAKYLAQKSLALHETKEAKELITKIEAIEEKQRHIEQAKLKIPKEEQEKLLAEAKEETQKNCRKLNIPENSTWFKSLQKTKFEEKLLAAREKANNTDLEEWKKFQLKTVFPLNLVPV